MKQRSKRSCERRHDDHVKQFAHYLFLLAGRKAYTFLQANLNFLPSICTLRRMAASRSSECMDPYFVEQEAREFYDKLGYDGPFLLSDDCTALLPLLRYDATRNSVVGFPLKLEGDSTALQSSSIRVMCADEVYNFHAAGHGPAQLAHAQVLYPLSGRQPPFVLSVLPMSNTLNGDGVKRLWSETWRRCERAGLKVVVRGHDGDAKNVNNCMARLKEVLRDSFFSVDFAGGSIKVPKLMDSLRSRDVGCFVQDPLHLGVKAYSFLHKTLSEELQTLISPKKKALKPAERKIGSVEINMAHLLESDGSCVKLRPGCGHIRPGDIRFCDRMNVGAYERVFSVDTIKRLANRPECAATHAYIVAMRRSVDAFTDEKLSTHDRVRYCWYAAFFLLLWGKLGRPKGRTFTHLTACCVVNALTVTSLADYQNGEKKGCRWGILGSQSCEQCFRGLRALTGGFCNVSNVAFLDAVQRIRKIQSMTQFESDFKHLLKFPQHDKKSRSDLSYFAEYGEECKISGALEDAWKEAKETLSGFFPAAAVTHTPHPGTAGMLFHQWVDFSSGAIPASFAGSWSTSVSTPESLDEEEEAQVVTEGIENEEARVGSRQYREIICALYDIAGYPRSNSTRLGRIIESSNGRAQNDTESLASS